MSQDHDWSDTLDRIQSPPPPLSPSECPDGDILRTLSRDPDIDGIGITSALLVNSWLAVLASFVHIYLTYYLTKYPPSERPLLRRAHVALKGTIASLNTVLLWTAYAIFSTLMLRLLRSQVTTVIHGRQILTMVYLNLTSYLVTFWLGSPDTHDPTYRDPTLIFWRSAAVSASAGCRGVAVLLSYVGYLHVFVKRGDGVWDHPECFEPDGVAPIQEEKAWVRIVTIIFMPIVGVPFLLFLFTPVSALGALSDRLIIESLVAGRSAVSRAVKGRRMQSFEDDEWQQISSVFFMRRGGIVGLLCILALGFCSSNLIDRRSEILGLVKEEAGREAASGALEILGVGQLLPCLLLILPAATFRDAWHFEAELDRVKTRAREQGFREGRDAMIRAGTAS